MKQGDKNSLPKGWEMKTLDQVSENLDSRRVPITKQKRNSGDIPYYGASGIVDYVSDYLFDENILCVSEDGANLLARTYPIAFSVSGKCWVNNHAHVLKFDNLITQNYVEYYLNSIGLEDFVSGMAQPKLNQSMLNRIPIPIPLLEEQQRIVAKLDDAFEAIEKAKANAEQNLKNAKELFESYLQAIFENKGKDWEVKTLGEVAKVMYGYTEKSSIEEIGPKFLRITDIQGDGVNWATVPYCKINDEDFDKYKLSSSDIVFARTGATTGKSYLVIDPPKSVFASYLIKVNIINIGLSSEFLFLFFQTKAYWNTINAGISGSAQGGFNATKLSELQIPIPSLQEQQTIVQKLDALSVETKKQEAIYQKKLEDLEELKKSILQKAFSGQL